MKRAILQLAATALLLPGGCRGVQSALDPRGDQASEIAALAWVLFAMAAFVLLAVTAAIWLAMRGSAGIRSALASRRAVHVGGIAFPAIVLTGLLGYNLWSLRLAGGPLDERGVERIEVVGEQWWWRTQYRASDGNGVPAANEIRLPAGRDVEFVLSSADVIHAFWIPALGGKLDMIPGRTTRLRLRAGRLGVYRSQCAEYCGGPHGLMALEVRAMPAAEFETWLAAQAAPAAEPLSDITARGLALFLAAGCGGCHAIRGTEAAGTVGPDLTHIGSRPSVGVDTLPMTPENIARFIAEGQHIKPGNSMPPFDIFSEDEMGALSAYLVGLR